MFHEIRKRSTREQAESYDLLIDGHVKNPSLKDVDNYIVSPMFGFEDCMDYSRQCGVNGRLHLAEHAVLLLARVGRLPHRPWVHSVSRVREVR